MKQSLFVMAFALSVGAPALGSSWSGKVVFYNVFHFNYVYDGKPVDAVTALPEVVFNDGSVTPTDPVKLQPMNGHLFGKATATVYASHHASGRIHEPRRLRVRYAVYTNDGNVVLTPSHPVPVGRMHSVYATPESQARSIASALDAAFTQVTDAAATASLFYLSEGYRDYVRN